MICSVCDKEKRLLNGKCLNCYRIKAVNAAKRIRDNWRQKAKVLKVEPYIRFEPKLSLTGYWIKLKGFIYNTGDAILTKAIDKVIDRFSLIIFIILIGVVVMSIVKRKS